MSFKIQSNYYHIKILQLITNNHMCIMNSIQDMLDVSPEFLTTVDTRRRRTPRTSHKRCCTRTRLTSSGSLRGVTTGIPTSGSCSSSSPSSSSRPPSAAQQDPHVRPRCVPTNCQLEDVELLESTWR